MVLTPSSEIREDSATIHRKGQTASRTYFNATSVLSLGRLFELMATEVVEEASEADIVLSDGEHTLAEGVEHIHSYDFERITALIG